MLKDLEQIDLLPTPQFSNKHKKKINRIFREIANCSKIPYPEVDNCFEQFRSKLALKFTFLKIKNKR